MANIFSFSDIKKNDPPGGGGGFPPGFPGGGGPPGGGFPGGSPGGNRAHEDRKRVIMVTSAQQFRQQLQSAEGLAVVDWSAAWCVPCQKIFPILANLSEKYADVVFMKIDVDMMRALADEYNIRALPTFHFFKKGQKLDELEGADAAALEQKIQTHHVAVKKWGGGVRLNDDATQIFTGGIVRSANDPAPAPVAGGGAVGGDGAVLEPLLQNLIEMGFSETHARHALIATNNAGLEQAIDWIVTHPEDSLPALPASGQTLGGGVAPMDYEEEDDADASDALKQILAARRQRQQQVAPAAASPAVASPVEGGAPAPVEGESESAPSPKLPMNCELEMIAEPSSVIDEAQRVKFNPRNVTIEPNSELIINTGAVPEQLSYEEREKRIQARLAAIQEQKRLQAEKEEIERERKRIKDAAAATQTREHLEEVRRNAEIQEAKRKKLADKRAKEEIRERIRLAQLERAEKFGGVPSAQPAAASAPAPASAPAAQTAPATTAEYKDCALAIRLPNGTTVKQTFLPTDTLRTVYNFLSNSNDIRNFSLVTNYPRKVYSGAALDSTTLQQAELVPRGALSVQY